MKRRKVAVERSSIRSRSISTGVYYAASALRCVTFDAIVMSHEHEMSTFTRNGDRVDLPALLEIGHKFQKDTDWVPPTKRVKTQKDEDSGSPDTAAAVEAESD